MTQSQVLDQYFEWLCSLIEPDHPTHLTVEFRSLLIFLHDNEFTWIIPRDENRAADGISLRRDFGLEFDIPYEEYLVGPCSVLEMLLGLAVRCEREIMSDYRYGDRTGQWFWHMVNNIGFGGMFNDLFNKKEAQKVLNNFLQRKFKANGVGSIFTTHTKGLDYRTTEFWFQMTRYFSEHP